MTTELERIKILEAKISQVVSYVNKILTENEKLKQQIKELKAEKKAVEESLGKAERLDESLKKYEKEREMLKERIEAVIGQIDQLGI